MMRLLQLFILTTTLLLAACGRSDFATHSGAGASISSGKWQLINYWATWCAPCREEIPALNTFDQQDNVTVYGINYDGLEGEELQAAIDEMGITFDSLLADPAPALNQDRPRVLPSTFVLNPKGEVVQVLTGPQTAETLAAAIHSAQ